MDDNQPNKSSEGSDAEWEAIRKNTPGLEDETDDAATEKVEEEESEETEETTTEEEPEEKKEPAKTEEKSEEEEEEPESKEKKPARPEKYIPVKQYTDEKKGWKDTVAEKDKRIKELEDATSATGKDKADKIKAYAEKHDIPVEQVQDLAEILTQELGGKQEAAPEKEKELDAETTQLLQEARENRAEKLFNNEFTEDALPALKTLFPDATAEQLEAAKVEVSKLAATKKFLDKPLDHVVLKSKSELSDVFSKKISKSIEGSDRAPQKNGTDYTAKDFKDGGLSFAELAKLPAEKQAKIVEDMDVPTYDRYIREMRGSDKLVINRGGRTIET